MNNMIRRLGGQDSRRRILMMNREAAGIPAIEKIAGEAKTDEVKAVSSNECGVTLDDCLYDGRRDCRAIPSER